MRVRYHTCYRPGVDAHDLSGTVLDGRYKVIAPLSEGAMGSVYRGERLQLGRAVAIKVMHEALPDELASRQRFEREAKLMAMLEQFSVRGVNLSRIESRPIGDEMGRYSFSLDVEGHIRDERVGEAVMGLHRRCPYVRFLGSYPRADAVAPTVHVGTSDADFVGARTWLQALRAGQAT